MPTQPRHHVPNITTNSGSAVRGFNHFQAGNLPSYPVVLEELGYRQTQRKTDKVHTVTLAAYECPRVNKG